ncbi:MAG: helix-hairpin-helix domain-containing protein, partial [Candidatus Binatia bacterium]
MSIELDNEDIGATLERVADLLEVQHASTFRVKAYRNAADTVRMHEESVAKLAREEGVEGLDRLPAIGKTIAAAIRELVASGRLAMLDRLEGQVSPEDLIMTVPGIGEKLAHRIHEELGVETLEELEVTAHDGRLEAMSGVGRRKVQGLRDMLASMLARSSRRHARHPDIARDAPGATRMPSPSIEEVLSVDAEYLEKACAGKLRKITPRRFNPAGEAWLPILHTEREGRSYTALFSNTQRAHQLGKTDDWV